MALFVGEFEQAIDGKHRLAINSALRETMNPQEDGQDFVLMLGPDRHLWLYPDLLYRQKMLQMRQAALPSRQSRKIDLLFAMARLLKMDSQGRVVLPEKSMQRAIIAPKVTLVGQYEHIEIWPTDEWEQHVQDGLVKYGDEMYEAADRLATPGRSQNQI